MGNHTTGLRVKHRDIRRSVRALAVLLLSAIFLMAGCGSEEPANSATAASADDLEGHHYADVNMSLELRIDSDDTLTVSRWDTSTQSSWPYEFKDDQIIIDSSEGGPKARSQTLRKSKSGGWTGHMGNGAPVRLVPVTPDIQARIDAGHQLLKDRETLLSSRPSSDADYYPITTDAQWALLYASRQPEWTDEELADFLIPGHHNEADAFKKRELFAQLPALKAELQTWSERKDFVFEDADSAMRHFLLAGPYAFESSGFPVSGSVCSGNTVFGPARLSFIEWAPANCIVPVDEATARRIEQSRATSQSLVTSKIYFRAIGIVNQNLQADAHKADLTIWHRPDYTSDFSRMETLAKVTVKKAQPN